jgi:hypothetical protein
MLRSVANWFGFRGSSASSASRDARRAPPRLPERTYHSFPLLLIEDTPLHVGDGERELSRTVDMRATTLAMEWLNSQKRSDIREEAVETGNISPT